eukprot:Skav234384  [mRNA]  locus=scaffold2071:277554:279677:- [translate_table: standard]
MEMRKACDEDEKARLIERAKAMNAHIVFGPAGPHDEEKAEKLWQQHKKRAAWGCHWFHIWFQRVQRAVDLGQRLKVVYFPGQVGQGKVNWHMLPTANLWDGSGCGGSQKAEIAKLDQMSWSYDEVDVTQFLTSQFQVGETVDAFYSQNDGKTDFRKATILQVPNPSTSAEKDMKWQVLCQKTQTKFETIRIEKTTVFFDKLLHDCGEETLKSILADATNLKVKTVKEVRLPSGGLSLAVKFDLEKIEEVHKLRDAVLSDQITVTFNKALADRHGVTEELTIDKMQFFDQHAKSLLTFSELTPHQQQKLRELSKHKGAHMHLRAPAGGGKTFVALRYVLKRLRMLGQNPGNPGKILYICPGRPLIFHFLQWLLVHSTQVLPQSFFHDSDDLLQRLVVMHHPFEAYLTPCIHDSRMTLQKLRGDPEHVVLAVLDEAHDTFMTDGFLFHKIHADQKMILSDLSQSSSLQDNFPEAHMVTLSQVVRSPKRLMLGAGTFRLKDAERTTCIGTTGPPIKTFLFETPEDEQHLFPEFAARALEAILHIAGTYGSIRFDRHIALIVPDESFYTSLRADLEKQLEDNFSTSRKTKLISFEESLCWMPGASQRDIGQDAIILDWDTNAKGLEKPFVICIGFDTKISGRNDNLTRSRLYHAMTRAQLQALVVDQWVPGGWLEFVSTLELKEDEFEASKAEFEVQKDAASRIVEETWLA